MFLAGDTLTNQIADHSAKEKPPQVQGTIKTLKWKRLDVEALRTEGPCGLPDSSARFRACRTKSVAFQNSDAQAAQILFSIGAQRNGSGERIAGVGPGHYFEKQAHICNTARHGADNADPGKCAGAWREMSRCRNAARRRLQSADSAEMCRHANRAAAIAANASGRTARGNRRSFTTARTSRGVRQIPRIARFSMGQIVGLVGHQEFGSVGVAEKDGPSGLQSRYERGVPPGNVAHAQNGASGAGPPGNVNATLDCERNAVERSNWITAQDRRFRDEGLDAGFAVQMYKSIERWLARLDALEMGANDFDGRELFRADTFGNLLDRGVGRSRHDLKRETMRASRAGQALRSAPSSAHNNG